MALIDGNGRVFGRVNLIDAALLVFVLALIPIGVVTSRVFRERVPRIDAVQPASQPAGPARRIRVKGANFRPYLKVFVNRTGDPISLVARNPDLTEGHFLIESPTEVEIQLPPLAPGSYGLYVFDEARQVLAYPSAFTIEPPPSAPLRATVQFVAVPDVAALVKLGDTDLLGTTTTAPSPNDAGAVIQALGVPAKTVSAVFSYGLPSGPGTLAVAGPARTLEAQLSIPAKQNESGLWIYRNQPIRPGDTINFETPRYSMRGLVIAVSPRDSAKDGSSDPRGARQ